MLTVEALPARRPGPNEVVVAVPATAVNPGNVKNVQGQFTHTILPRTPGRDLAGVVVKAGTGAQEWTGREVFGTGDLGFDRDVSHAERLIVPAKRVAALRLADATEAYRRVRDGSRKKIVLVP